MKEVKTIIYPEQCKEYYKALEDGDMWAANLWYIPPIHRSWEDIQSDICFNEIVERHEAEQKFIEETPNELLRVMIENKFGSVAPKKEKTNKTFWQWLFEPNTD